MSVFPNCISLFLLKVLKKCFHRWGIFVGNYAIPIVVVSLILCCAASAGLFRFSLGYNLTERFAPIGARSRQENELYSKFFSGQGKPWEAFVAIWAADDGSVLRGKHLEAAANVSKYLEKEFKATTETGEEYGYEDLCDLYCGSNRQLESFQTAFSMQEFRVARDSSFDTKQIRLDYPVSVVYGNKFDMAMNFFGVERNESFRESDWAYKVTPIEEVKLIMLTFKGNYKNQTQKELFTLWELQAFTKLNSLYEKSVIKVTLCGDEVISREVGKSGMIVMPYFVLGFGILLIFAVATVTGSSIYQGFKRANVLAMVLVIVAGVLSPVLASAATFGLVLFFVPSVDSIAVVVPFLVLAIGVDDAFLMIHAWQQMGSMGGGGSGGRGGGSGGRLGVVLEETGPSILITSLTNALAFAVGVSTTTPAISFFCAIASAGMVMDFLFEITFFAGILSLSDRLEKRLKKGERVSSINSSSFPSRRWSVSSAIIKRQNRISPIIPRLNQLQKATIRIQSNTTLIGRFLQKYSNAIASKWATAGALLFLVGYWTFVGFGTYRMRAELSGDKVFLRSSKIHPVERLRHEYIFKQYHTVTVIVNHAPDFSNPHEYDRFMEMVKEYESIPGALGSNSTKMWVKDYFPYSQTMIDNFGASCGISPESEDSEEYYDDEYDYSEDEGNDHSHTNLSAESDSQMQQEGPEAELKDEDSLPHETSRKHEATTEPIWNQSPPTSTSSSAELTQSVELSTEESNTETTPRLATIAKLIQRPEFSYNCLQPFLEESFRYWKPYVRWKHTQDPSDWMVSGFLWVTAYRNMSSWQKRTQLMQEWRGVAERWAGEFGTTIWNSEGLYYDQLLSVKSVTLQTVTLTFCCMTLVCFFFIPSLASCLCASLSVASICIGVYGCLSWWHIDLDPFTMGSVVMSIGFSVDYTAHISYHFFKGSRGTADMESGQAVPVSSAQRLHDALSHVGWPMIQAGLSTLLCIAVLCFVDSYMIEVFRKTVFLVVALGLLHGLLILPAILTALPDWMVSGGDLIHPRLNGSGSSSPSISTTTSTNCAKELCFITQTCELKYPRSSYDSQSNSTGTRSHSPVSSNESQPTGSHQPPPSKCYLKTPPRIKY